ncbi:MAG: NAD(P)-dependent alcohol dehydrogenase [Acidobacteriota bacterium]
MSSPETTETMRAMVHDAYGPLELLELRDVERPAPRANEVLVRVQAVGLHVGDCYCVRGAPLAMRSVSGWLRPKVGIPGFDVAGRVEAIGLDATGFAVGDEVFGASSRAGGCAELACLRQDELAHRPEALSPEEAAALPTSGLAALHALRDVARLQAGQRLLVIGASGGVGTFAVQVAKAFGAEVTGVCSTRNVELVRSLGADRVIDYTREDFAAEEGRWDVIFDNVENRSLSDCRRALSSTGQLILNSGTGARGLAMLVRLIKPLVLSPFVSQDLRRYLSVPCQEDLVALVELFESGQLRPVVEKTYSLHETAAALAHLETGRARGKVVVTT